MSPKFIVFSYPGLEEDWKLDRAPFDIGFFGQILVGGALDLDPKGNWKLSATFDAGFTRGDIENNFIGRGMQYGAMFLLIGGSVGDQMQSRPDGRFNDYTVSVGPGTGASWSETRTGVCTVALGCK